jgi:acyl carrier protein
MTTASSNDTDTPLEDVMCCFFQEALQKETVAAHDNFFDLGGHSFLAFKLIGSLEEVFGVSVPLRLIFEAPTPADFAKALREQEIVEAETIAMVLRQWDSIRPQG